MAAKLSESEIASALASAPAWVETGESIQRTVSFKDFKESMAFVIQVAAEAERVDHHPDILIRYSRVILTLSTHDAAGITTKDFALAKSADSLAARIAKDE